MRTPDAPASSITAPLILWLSLQVLLLIVGASGLKWSANHPEPADLTSLSVLLVGQLIAVTLLSKVFCSTPFTAIAIAATNWPFLLAAGYLSATPLPHSTLSGLYLTGWILISGVIHRIHAPLPTTVPALLALVVVGGPVLSYLIAEFKGGPIRDIGPVFDLLALASGRGTWRNTLLPMFLCAGALVFRLPKR